MQTLKFRGIDYDIGKVIYSDNAIIEGGAVVTLVDEDDEEHDVDPDTVRQLIFVDYNGREVYEGDIITMHPDFQPAPALKADFSFITVQERWQLVREVYYDGDINYDGELESFAIKRQAAALNDKLFRDARLGFSKSVFDLLPDLSELRDVD